MISESSVIRIFGFSFMAMSLLLPQLRSGHAVRTDRMQRAYTQHPFFAFIYTLMDFTVKCKTMHCISAIFRYFLQTFSSMSV